MRRFTVKINDRPSVIVHIPETPEEAPAMPGDKDYEQLKGLLTELTQDEFVALFSAIDTEETKSLEEMIEEHGTPF